MNKKCLWHAEDDRCASCKAKRYRHDVLGMKEDYDVCRPETDYEECDFYIARPAAD